SPPFVMKTRNNQFEGYAIDLINELSRVARFNYTLYPTPDEAYGQSDKSGKPSGMVQELFMRRADFAIGDLIKSQTRERYIDFSDSFMDIDLTALINKKNIANMTSFAHLVNNTNITYGVLREGDTFRFMSMSLNPTIANMHRYIYMNGFNLVNSRQEGVERALNTNYAFIQESVANEYAMDQNCELTAIEDKQEINRREYAIGLQKGSPYKSDIDRAIQQLRNDGTLNRLKRKYWRTKCLTNSDMMSVNAKLDAITSLSLIASALISYILFN
ncbi:unnamed protein product, partial [Oppiella nova]